MTHHSKLGLRHSPPSHTLISPAASSPFSQRLIKAGGLTKPQLLAQLTVAGVELNEYARVLFASDLFTTSPVERPWMTVEVSVHDLGFPEGATLAALHDKAQARGLIPPPLELAPHLRLQYLDQPEGHWGHPVTQHRAPPGSLTIASAPLTEDEDFPKGFYLRRIQDTLWLRGYRCSLDNLWNPDDRLVFCQP
jgi:hypothetical protein